MFFADPLLVPYVELNSQKQLEGDVGLKRLEDENAHYPSGTKQNINKRVSKTCENKNKIK